MDFSDDEVLPAAKKAARREKEKRMAKKDKLSLMVEDVEDDSEDDLDEPVYDIKGVDDSDENEDEGYEYDDDEEDDLDEEELTGLAAKMAKQAKYLKQKASAVGLEDEDEEEAHEGEDDKKAAWGKRKQAYYSGDNVDYELQSSDEEEPLEEEREALRLQRKAASSLRPEDFEQGEDEEDEDEKETLQESVSRLENGASAGKKQKKKKGREAGLKALQGGLMGGKDGDVAVERVAKDVNALSKEEQMAVIMSEAPELVGLLSELKEGLAEAKLKVQPLLEKVKAGDYATAEGISYLETKHLLLLSYCQCIMFYLLLKAEGRSVRDHPVIARLVEMRLFLEKLRPIDKKLQYQIEKLLKAANSAVGEGDDDEDADGAGAKEAALSFRPNPDLLVPKIGQSEEAGGGLYRPPMMVATSMEDEEGGKERRRRERAAKDAARRAQSSAFVQELAAEVEGRPEEVRDDAIGNESQSMLRERARLQRRMEAEEDLMARVPLSREERKRLKHMNKRPANGLLGMLDDFDDDVAGIVEMDDDTGGAPALAARPSGRKLSQAIAEAGRPAKKVAFVSGDADLPQREELGERRRKHETHHLARGRADNGLDSDAEGSDEGEGEGRRSGRRPIPEEDEVYQEARELRAAKLAAKADKYSRKEPLVPAEEEVAEGKRGITYQIAKNRGLTPHRKKLTKNPRKKYKLKFGKAVIARKGQVRDVRSRAKPYGGEETGIKANVSRSVRFTKS